MAHSELKTPGDQVRAEGGLGVCFTFMWILPPGAPLRPHNKYQGENPLMILAVGEKRKHF